MSTYAKYSSVASGGGGGGTGNVTGPGSSVTNDVATFADTTGTVIKDSTLNFTVAGTDDTLTSSGVGHRIILQGPPGGGDVAITAGDVSSASPAGGIVLTSGSNTGAGVAGDIDLQTGTSSSGTPGNIVVTGPLRTSTGYVVSPSVNAITGTSTMVLDLSLASYYVITLTANAVIGVTNEVAGGAYVIEIIQGSGSYAVTFSGILWPSGTAPSISVGSGAVDVINLAYDGTRILGTFAQDFA